MNEKSHPPSIHDAADREAAASDSDGRTASDDKFIVESDAGSDQFLAALDAAEPDDDAFTDDDWAAVQAGMSAYLRGESRCWKDVRKLLVLEDAAEKRAAS